MGKIYIIIIVSILSFNLFADNTADKGAFIIIKKGQVSPIDGYVIDETKLQGFKFINDELKQVKALNVQLNIIKDSDTITIADLRELVAEKDFNIKQDEDKFKAQEGIINIYKSMESEYKKINYYKIGLNVAIAFSFAELLGFGGYMLGQYLTK